jgi:DNA-binding MarR family transcriptional regulator
MSDDRTQLIRQVLDLRTDLLRALRPAREWLEVDLTMSQFKVLFLVYSDGGASMGQLAGSLGVTLSTVTGIVDRLVEHGMLQREENPHDRRLVVCKLTAEGSETVERLYQAGRSRFASLLDELTPAELQTVVEALSALRGAAHRLAAAEDLATVGGSHRVNGYTSPARSGAVFSR